MPSALIVGAGPAGLFCAYSLRRGGFDGAITLVEKGLPFSERFASRDPWDFNPHEVLSGEGGAGFLADAKLCLSASAGVQFDADISADYPRAFEDLDFHVYQRLLDLGHEIRRAFPNPAQLRAARKVLGALGLTLDSYPVRPLGSDMAGRFLASLVEDLRRLDIRILYKTSAKSLEPDSGGAGFRVRLHGLQGDYDVSVSHVFLAVGWSGSEWLRRQKLPLSVEANPLDIGVRIEFPAWGGEQLRECGDNPKIKLRDDASYTKTHCLVHRGRVFFYYMDDLCLVDAHAVRGAVTQASAINILYRVPTSMFADPLSLLTAFSAATKATAQAMPLAMTMPEFLGRRDLPHSGAGFSPTLQRAVRADLGFFLPSKIADAIRSHISRLAEYAPGIATSDSVVYAPAAQWVTPKIKLGSRFAVPNVRNLWCIGDGSGVTAGVLPAAVSGVAAAKSALAQLRGGDQLTLWSFP